MPRPGRHIRRIRVALVCILACALSPLPGDAATARIFPETGQESGGAFYAYWLAHGQVAILGFPLSKAYVADTGFITQVYERTVLEWHPENPAADRVLLARLGDRLSQGIAQRTTAPALCAGDCESFPATRHSLRGVFRAFWRANGGLANFGYPLTEEFPEQNRDTGESYTVQYFERNRFEYHPGREGGAVLLGRLGAQLYEPIRAAVDALPTATVPDDDPAPAAPAADPASLALRLEAVAQGFAAPLYATHAGDGSGRLFVVEKRGTIAIARDGRRLPAPFLDLTALVGSGGSEQGLLSVAFHPHYATNGLFFVDYTDKQGNTVVARYAVSADPDAADPRSGRVLLHIDQPYANHNGGLVRFGPDGYLYIGMGDGGSQGDPHGNGQDTHVLLGKLLRIDADHGDPYAIPPDNPFADGKAGRPEVWAYGLRNPWRFAFDPPRGLLFVADVGQNAYEEVDAQPASRGGVNYGWNRMEGQHCYPADAGCDRDGLALPVGEYGHDKGCSITGGGVYRGSAYPRLTGMYLFGDYCSGGIWTLDRTDGGTWRTTEVLQSGIQISSFGEDEAGELYATGLGDGTLYRIAA